MTAKFLKLRDPEHRFPMPGSPGLLFPASGQSVDADLPIWANLLADGSLVEADPPPESVTQTETEPLPALPLRTPSPLTSDGE